MRTIVALLACLFFALPAHADGYHSFGRSIRGAWGGLAPTALCPQGSSLGDGCPLANINSAVQHTNFFTGYANQSSQTYATRPAWNVAGVDYPVGHYTATASLADPAVVYASSVNGCQYYSSQAAHTAGPILYCQTSANLTLSGLNFGPIGGHGCTFLYLSKSGNPTVTITNNLFVADQNCLTGGTNTLIQATTTSAFSLVFTYNTMDGCATTDTFCASAITVCGCDLVADFKSGSSTWQYNAFLNSPGRDISGGNGTSYASNNYIEGLAVGWANNAAGHHGEFIEYQRPDTTPNPLIVATMSYNTCLLPASQGSNNVKACFYYSAGGGPTDTGSVGPASTTMTITAAGGLYSFVTGNYVGSGNSLPDLTKIVTGSGGVGTYTLNNSGTLSAGSPIVGGLQFSTAQFDHNVIVGNLSGGLVTASAGLESGAAILSGAVIQNNYIDQTGIYSGRYFAFGNVSCQNVTSFSGNIDLVAGTSANTLFALSTNYNC